jgi:hypothetical protein
MDFLHVDIWVPAGTDRLVKVTPINDPSGTGTPETLVVVPLTPGSWNSVMLPKSDFTGMTWDAVYQLKFDGQFNSDGSANTTPFDIYLDNIYFSKTPTTATTVVVGAGSQTSGTNDNATVVYRSSASSTFDYSQNVLLYTFNDLSAAGIFNGAVISSIGFFKSDSNEITPGQVVNLSIDILNSGGTDLSTADTYANLTAGSTNVFNGTVDNTIFSTASLVQIDLQTPITYTGGSLEIGINWDASAISGNPTTGTFTWLRDPSTTNQARGTSNSSAITGNLTTARPAVYQAQFIYTGGVAPTCLPPNSLTVTATTVDSATLAWTSGGSGETAWDIEVVPAGTTPTGTPTNAGVINPYMVTGLTGNTAYDYYVRASCGSGDFSTYSGPFSFVTDCVAVADFNENFDAVAIPDLPNCWTSIVNEFAVGTDPAVGTSTAADNSVPNGARLYNGSGDLTTPNDAYLISPQLTTLGAGTHRLKFFGDASPAGDVEIGTITNPLDPSTFTLFQTISLTTIHTEYIIDFSSYTGTDRYIAFKHPNTTTLDSIYLDDIIFEAIPSCPDTANLTFVSNTDTTATINFDSTNATSAGNYEYSISTVAGAAPAVSGSWSDVAGVTPNVTYTITGLTAETEYFVHVREVCGGGDFSPWSSIPVNFTTACAPFTAPYFVDFENFTAAISGFELDQCWQEVSPTIFDWAIDNSGGTGSSNTGPSAAFSGTTFMFVEASNGANGDVATVHSPLVDLSALATPSVSFYYHMYGAFITDLTVGVSTDNGLTFTTELVITGQQQTASTDNWLQAIIDLSSYAGQTVMVSFSTSKSMGPGNTFEADIAIDDVSFDELPQCIDVSMVTVDSFTSDTVTVSWTENNTIPATAWEVIAVPAGDPVPAVGALNVTTNPFTVSGLSSNTAYDVYVRTDCATTFVRFVSVTTACTTFVPDAIETFDTFLPDCWQVADAGDLTTGPSNFGTSQWFAEEFAHASTTGGGAVNINLYRAVVSDWIVSPLYDLSAGGYELNIDVALTDYNNTAAGVMGSDDLVAIAYTIDDINWTTLKVWDVNDQPATAGETYNNALAGINSATVRFGIYATDGAIDDTGIDYDFHIDNFQIRTPPSCPDTANLTLVSTTVNSATINFDSGNAASAGNYEYSLSTVAGATPVVTGSWSDVAGANPNVTYTITGLTAQTEYFVHVREVCAPGNFGTWSLTPLNFTTDCDVVTNYPYITDFNSNPPNSCWDVAGAGEIGTGPSGFGTSEWRTGTYNNASGTPTVSNTINLYFNTFREWLITESFDMTGPSNNVLTVEVAVTDWLSATAADVMGSDDQVDLLITTDNGVTWTSLRSWTAADQLTATGTREFIDLSSYTGIVRFAFLASDGIVNDAEDYDFHVGIYIIDGTAGNEDAFATSLSLYPNPVSGDVVTVNMNAASSAAVNVAIYNTLGQQVINKSFDQVNQSITIDNLSNLAKGMYLIRITNGDQQSTLKFIKE